jgi:glycerol-3-phosphate O-acyltransferase/dihydroxyacetone phosphate acyltransferase
MIYTIFKWLFTPTVKAYFRDLHVENFKVIPDKGPVILAVNHTSAFMDPILIAVFTKRILHFLARGEAFNSGFSRWLYGKLNMLPVYRPETTPDEVHKNKFVFEKCYEHLSKGKCIIIFPEGFSKTERRLRPIKNGLARIALGAEAQNDFSLDTKIIPIGINYSNPHRFPSEVFVHASEPISCRDYETLFKESEKKAYDQMTEDVTKAMTEATIVIEDEKLDEFYEGISYLQMYDIDESGAEIPAGKAFFDVSKDLSNRINEMSSKDPVAFEKLSSRLLQYTRRIDRLRLKDRHLRVLRFRDIFGKSLLLLMVLPIAIYGFLTNIIPYALTALLSARITVREDFVGSLKMAGGMFIFLIFYILQSVITISFFGWTLGIFALISFYPTGLVSMFFLKQGYELIQTVRHGWIFRKKSRMIHALQKQRKSILESIRKQVGDLENV